MRNLFLIAMALVMAGCEAGGGRGGSVIGVGGDREAVGASSVVVYLGAERLSREDLYEAMPPSAWAAALADRVVRRGIERRLTARGLEVNDEDLEAERELLMRQLSPDPDEAARLVRELRRREGLDLVAFEAVLERSAGLRKLVASEVVVDEAAIERAYELRYGPRVQARLIVVDELATASEVLRRLGEDASFGALAAELSTDPSAVRGGLLEPLSPLDPTLPEAIRAGLRGLAERPAGLSDILALETGYAVLRYERTVEPDERPLSEVRDDLAREVRARAESLRMRELARVILSEADVTVLDPRLSDAWQERRRATSATGLLER
ncbi:peptidylprolyl isomerase [Mucisphaera sp.]|uniref:peptidylprolyl isomerase n=1 Tax=Mucisphaera sp. TaxID=2913024 RepID=UPI003D0F4D4D